jgi:hypothetical protein
VNYLNDATRTQIRKNVRKMAENARLELDAKPGRRKSDIIVITLAGRRREVLQFPWRVLERFLPAIDVELLESGGSFDGSGRLVMAITEPLDAQGGVRSERRGKLKLRGRTSER